MGKFRKVIGLALLLAALVAGDCLYEYFSHGSILFITTQNLRNILPWIGLFGILSLGEALVIVTGGIDLSIGSVVALVGLVAAVLIRDAGWPALAAIPVALALSAGNRPVARRPGGQGAHAALCGHPVRLVLLSRNRAASHEGHDTRVRRRPPGPELAGQRVPAGRQGQPGLDAVSHLHCAGRHGGRLPPFLGAGPTCLRAGRQRRRGTLQRDSGGARQDLGLCAVQLADRRRRPSDRVQRELVGSRGLWQLLRAVRDRGRCSRRLQPARRLGQRAWRGHRRGALSGTEETWSTFSGFPASSNMW